MDTEETKQREHIQSFRSELMAYLADRFQRHDLTEAEQGVLTAVLDCISSNTCLNCGPHLNTCILKSHAGSEDKGSTVQAVYEKLIRADSEKQ